MQFTSVHAFLPAGASADWDYTHFGCQSPDHFWPSYRNIPYTTARIEELKNRARALANAAAHAASVDIAATATQELDRVLYAAGVLIDDESSTQNRYFVPETRSCKRSVAIHCGKARKALAALEAGNAAVQPPCRSPSNHAPTAAPKHATPTCGQNLGGGRR